MTVQIFFSAMIGTVFLACGLLCLIVGLFLLKVELAMQSTTLAALGVALFGLFFFLCAQIFIGKLLDVSF